MIEYNVFKIGELKGPLNKNLIEIHNNCPHCNIVNQPSIIGYIENPEYVEKWFKSYANDTYEIFTEPMSDGEEFDETKFRYELKETVTKIYLDVIYHCSNTKCLKIFTGHYECNVLDNIYKEEYKLTGTSPNPKLFIPQNEEISKISEKYYEIYRQAFIAEKMGLTDICGMGYRKALEFLLKDFVLFLNKGQEGFNEEKIKEKFLGKIIADDVSNIRLKEVASRAVWLGNDETHYFRKWVEKDVQDLKNIISIVLHEIEMELAYKKVLEDMPSGR